MAPPSVPVGIPDEFVAGDTVVWDDASFVDSRGSFAQTDGFALAYYLISAGGDQQKVDAVAQGSGWRTTVAAAISGALKSPNVDTPETVTWFARVSKGGESYTVARGTVRLIADPAKLNTYADPLDAELAEVEAAIKAAKGITQYQVPGRAVTRDLTSLYRRRAALIDAKRRRQNGGALPARLVAFNSPNGIEPTNLTEWFR